MNGYASNFLRSRAQQAMVSLLAVFALGAAIAIGCGASSVAQTESRYRPRPTDQISTIEPGVHHFQVRDVQRSLASWLQHHREYIVTAMAPDGQGGYYVVTTVNPAFLLRPGLAPGQVEDDPDFEGFIPGKRPDQKTPAIGSTAPEDDDLFIGNGG